MLYLIPYLMVHLIRYLNIPKYKVTLLDATPIVVDYYTMESHVGIK